ncbi:hypothetical protein ACFWY9_36805 [Amycolatopsis sp. NPDC059027]|uniref:hypothetical protein n=1 Tax=unclassified Amycolatopsis TaxID=2618356 RepID=UPI00366CF0BE
MAFVAALGRLTPGVLCLLLVGLLFLVLLMLALFWIAAKYNRPLTAKIFFMAVTSPASAATPERAEPGETCQQAGDAEVHSMSRDKAA